MSQVISHGVPYVLGCSQPRSIVITRKGTVVQVKNNLCLRISKKYNTDITPVKVRKNNLVPRTPIKNRAKRTIDNIDPIILIF